MIKKDLFFSEDLFYLDNSVGLMKSRIMRHFIWVFPACKSTEKPVLRGHLKIDKT